MFKQMTLASSVTRRFAVNKWTVSAGAALLLATTSFLPAQPSSPPGTATFKTGSRLVVVDVTVTNDSGPVRGLTKDDFILEERGKKQDIVVFTSSEVGKNSAPATPLAPGISSNRLNSKGEAIEAATVLLYDRVNTAASDQAFVRGQVLKILAGLKDTDKIGFYSLGFNLAMVRDFNEDAAPLVKVAKRLLSNANSDGLTGAELTLYKALTDALSPMQDLQNQARVNVTQAAFPMIGRHLAGVPGRKNLVWIVSRFPLTFGNSSERRRQDEAEVQAFANNLTEANITVFPVDPGGNGASFNTSSAAPAAAEGSLMATRGQISRTTATTNTVDTATAAAASSLTGNQSFQIFANATGGKAYRNSNDIGPQLREVLDSGSFTYTLGFVPDEKTMDDKPHKLEVKLVKKPATDKAKLAFRKEYLAWGPKSGPDVHPRPVSGELLGDSLDSTAIGLVGVANLDPAKPGFHQLDTRVSISDMSFQQRGDKWVGAFDMVVGLDGQPGANAETFNLSWTDAEYKNAFGTGLIVGKSIQTGGTSGVFHVIIQDKASGVVGSVRVPFVSK